MDFVLQKLLFFTVFFVFAFEVVESGFNAVYLKRTEANFTCGNPPEDFYETQQGHVLEGTRLFRFETVLTFTIVSAGNDCFVLGACKYSEIFLVFSYKV